jgi:UDP-3-O-[3-hydroxymyristoyl] glucosamine N-acyltransferase
LATLKELADIVQGTVVGNTELKIKGVSTIQDGKPETITFIAHPKYLKFVQSTQAAAVITSSTENLKDKDGILVENPQWAMAKVLGHFSPKYSINREIHKTAIIASDVLIGENVSIGPYTIIEKGVVIGDNVVIGANNMIDIDTAIGQDSEIKSNVHLYPRTSIGKRCLIHSGAVIGSDGYGFVSQKEIHLKIPQNGKVLLGMM